MWRVESCRRVSKMVSYYLPRVESITFPSSTESEENANAEEVLQQTYKRMRALRKRIEKANQALRSLESKPGRLDDFVSIEQRQELIVRDAAKRHV